MRHDPASAAIIIMLRSLKMYGMAQAVTDLMEQGAPAFDTAVPMLSQLLKAELAEREVRSIAYHMKSARFPAYKDLSGFDFATSEINEATEIDRGASCTNASSWMAPRMPCSSAGREPAKPMSRRLSASRQLNTTAEGSASSQPSSWSTRWSRKRPRARPDRSPKA